MKTKEFMAKVRSLEFEIEMEGCWVVIRTISGAKQLKINKKYASVVFFRGNYSSEIDRNLLNLVVGYLNTPKEDREDPKRYRVKFPGISRDGRNIYLMRQSNRDGTYGIDWSPEEYIFDDFPDGYLFTEKEIKSINEHYWHFAEEGEEDE